MQKNYEQIVTAQQSQPGHTEARVSDEVKFSVVCIIYLSSVALFLQLNVWETFLETFTVYEVVRRSKTLSYARIFLKTPEPLNK